VDGVCVTCDTGDLRCLHYHFSRSSQANSSQVKTEAKRPTTKTSNRPPLLLAFALLSRCCCARAPPCLLLLRARRSLPKIEGREM
jgi:hypothetical protein